MVQTFNPFQLFFILPATRGGKRACPGLDPGSGLEPSAAI